VGGVRWGVRALTVRFGDGGAARCGERARAECLRCQAFKLEIGFSSVVLRKWRWVSS